MNILIALNSNYIYPLSVMLHSMALTNKSTHFDIYVLYSSLTEDDFATMEKAVGDADVVFHRVVVDEKIFDNSPILSRTSKETYYRLLISDLIPDDIDRILYIDPDVVIKGDLSELYNMDLCGNVIAAGTHMDPIANFINTTRIGLKISSIYINAGIMLIDVKKWNEEMPVSKIMNFISTNYKKLRLADQDVVNLMLEDKICIFDERKYNLDEKTYLKRTTRVHTKKPINLDWVEKNTVIIHYNGKSKPWGKKEYKRKLGGYFEEYKNF